MVEWTALLSGGTGILRVIGQYFLVIIATAFIGFLGYWVILRPKIFKYDVDLYDLTGGGMIASRDLARTKSNKGNTFTKLASLKHRRLVLPPINNKYTVPTKRGQKKAVFYASDETGGNWIQGVVRYDAKNGLEIEPVSQDLKDWAIRQVDFEHKKFDKASLLKTYAPIIALGLGAVVFLGSLFLSYDLISTNNQKAISQANRLIEIEEARNSQRDAEIEVTKLALEFLEKQKTQEIKQPEEEGQIEQFVKSTEEKIGG